MPPQGIVRGGYRLRTGSKGKLRTTLLGSGTILREVIAAADLLESQFKIPADVYSITSFSELRREALDCERWNLLHPADPPRVPYVSELLGQNSRRRSSPPPTTCAPLPIRFASGCPAPTSRWAPTASVARMRARRCAGTSRSIAISSRWRRSRRWPTADQIDRRTVIEALAQFGIDPAKPNPLNS